MISPFSTAKKHILNFPGKRLDKKYVVFESDDWGSERIPSMKALNYLTTHGIDLSNNPFNNLDSLETGEDLSALFETIEKYSDRQGNHPAITANTITANPDFVKIKASGYSEYHYESSLQSYSHKNGCENSYSIINEGITAGIYHPQFHGREHLNVKQWLSALQSGNELLFKAFSAGVYSIDFNHSVSDDTYFMAAFNSMTDVDRNDYVNIINEGLFLFRSFFGYAPLSFMAPCYRWHPSLEPILHKNGIKYLQGLPVQYAPVAGGKDRKIYHYQGERNKMDQLYFVRNCFFEPALNPGFNWIKDCLNRLKIIFFWGKPAIIGTHRVNFIGSLNEDNRKHNLEVFSVLLRMILETWPDVEFTTTDKLGELY